MPHLIRSTVAFLAALLLALPGAWAAVDRDQAASAAQQKVPGRVLKVERGVHVDSSVVWRVQVLTSGGQVRTVVVDAETGRLR